MRRHRNRQRPRVQWTDYLRHNGRKGFVTLKTLRRGGKVYGKWRGLEQEQLYEGRDIALTTDFHLVFAEIWSDHLGASKLDTIFPGFAAERKSFLGIV
jgi:uncharacterized protein (DUF1501 family)